MPTAHPTLLSNSAFASLNLFSTAPNHLPSRPSTPYPQTKPARPRASSRAAVPPCIPARLSSVGLQLDITHSTLPTPDLSYYLESSISSKDFPSPPLRTPSPSPFVIPLDSPSSFRSRLSLRSSSMFARPSSVIDLGSPCVISGEHDAEAKRGSVHIGKERPVNWARPFQAEDRESKMQIFGQSAQRARRMKKPHSTSSDLAYPSPSSSSSDDESLPLTPSPQDMNRSWTVATELTGLGVKGIKDFDAFREDAITIGIDEIHLDSPTSSITTPVELNSPVLFSITPPLPQHLVNRRRGYTPVRLLSSSQSLNSLGSPNNLAELRQLQQAAIDLESEARRSYRSAPPKERRIRRKAVPFVPEEDISYAQASGSGSSQAYTLEVARSPESFHSDSSSSSSADESDSPICESVGVALASPIAPIRHESPMRRFYGNAKATMSMIDVSPRTASLPFIIPPRSESKPAGHQRATSDPVGPTSPPLPVARKNSSDGYSDSGESWDQPVTPNSFGSGMGRVGGNGFQLTPSPPAKAVKKLGGGIYGNKSAFLSQLDLGLKRVLERKDGEEDDSKKNKPRGFSRFLGKKL